MIVILSNKFDLSVDYVVRYLRKCKARFIRVNTEDLIYEQVETTFPKFSLCITNKGKQCDLSKNLHSVLFRRPGKPFEFSQRSNRPKLAVIKYIENQWHTYLESLCLIDNVLWVNDPLRNHQAENKILQLKRANELGFHVPKTCITSSKERAIEFSETCTDGVVAKALRVPLIECRNKDFFIYTTKVTSFQFPDSEFRIAPTIFQQAIVDKIDYRVTIVGSTCFAVKIQSTSDALVPLDWRSAKDRLQYIPVTLPVEIENKCLRLVKDLGLVFGAIDLVESNGQFLFLEINPSGEWGWIQKDAQLPIAEALGELLIHGYSKADQ